MVMTFVCCKSRCDPDELLREIAMIQARDAGEFSLFPGAD